jgi:hypothetical protein
MSRFTYNLYSPIQIYLETKIFLNSTLLSFPVPEMWVEKEEAAREELMLGSFSWDDLHISSSTHIYGFSSLA